jgi:hypothetical protein
MGLHRDGSRHSHPSCIVCGRQYLRYHSQLLQSSGRFCSRRCFWQSWKAFSRLLASGQLEGILAMPVCQEVLDGDEPATRRKR